MIYFLTGITASGKSNLAHKLALELGMSILSVDSMAVYKNLNVLTAKPTEVMQAQVRYYGLNIAETTQNFSVVDYLNYLIKEDIPSKSFTEDILAVGGTGLYIKAMIDKYEFKPTDPTIRAELEQLNYDNLLKFHDVNKIPLPETELNKRRLIRNIEDFMLNESKYVFPDLCMPANYVGVFWNHPDYKENIKLRTKNMLETGLLAEIDSLKNPSKTVLQAIGLNESGDIEENINLKTNRLAKKQITWFKKETKIKMLNTSDESVVYKEMMDILNE